MGEDREKHKSKDKHRDRERVTEKAKRDDRTVRDDKDRGRRDREKVRQLFVYVEGFPLRDVVGSSYFLLEHAALVLHRFSVF